MRYTYGTNNEAEARLELIARFFNPKAAEFIDRYVEEPVEVAVDLGCGPGFTTQMLFNALGSSRVFGLDRSADFLKMAASRLPQCTFIRHDVTETPFPVQPDLMYTRFLLSHLADAADLIRAWTGELNRGGILLIEEIEDITAEVGVFRRYLEIAKGLVASEGACLYAGKSLAEAAFDGRVLCNELISFALADAEAASWFLPNTLTVWEKEKFVLEQTTAEERKAISSELRDLAGSSSPRSRITWIMRRLAIVRD